MDVTEVKTAIANFWAAKKAHTACAKASFDARSAEQKAEVNAKGAEDELARAVRATGQDYVLQGNRQYAVDNAGRVHIDMVSVLVLDSEESEP